MFDRRFLPARAELVKSLSGHFNTTSVYLGCDIWQNSILALAGEDKKVRIWSLETGRQLNAVRSDKQSLLGTTFEDRIPEIKFREAHNELEVWLANGPVLSKYVVDCSSQA